MDALMMRIKAGKVPWMSTVLRYNCLEEVTALGVEPRVPRGRAPPDKGKNREYAKKSYYKHHDKNKKKNIVNQIRRGSQPKQETLERYGLSENKEA